MDSMDSSMGERMLHEDLTGRILDAAFEVSGSLGHGFLEGVYRKAMVIALQARGLGAEEDVPYQVRFKGHVVGDYRADLVVDRTALVELKAVKSLLPEHQAQAINYLKASGLPVALLINFGTPRIEYRRCHPGSSPEKSV